MKQSIKWGVFQCFGVFLVAMVAVWGSVSLAVGGGRDLMVKSVIDGDTIETSDGQVVRLLGINAPDKSSELYEKSVVVLGSLLKNKTVWIEKDRYLQDRYGRDLGWVFINCEREPDFLPANYMVKLKNSSNAGLMENPKGCERGMLVNETMVKMNLADVYFLEKKGDMKYEERLSLVEQDREAQESISTGSGVELDTPLSTESRLGSIAVPGLRGTNFSGYKVFFSPRWTPDFLSGRLTMSFENYSLVIEQALHVRSVGCDFKDSVSAIFPKLDLTGKSYKEIKAGEYKWRYYLGNTEENGDRRYDFCVSSGNGYETGSKFGFVSMVIPDDFDQTVVNEMKMMIGSLETRGQ